jgi:hypothetical protein
MFKSIVCTYPDFRGLPKGLKQMLVATENLFFSEVKSPAAQAGGLSKNLWEPLQKRFFTRPREIPHAHSRAFDWEYWSR